MTRPTPFDLLEAWEHGRGLPPSDRCLALLAAGEQSASIDDVARLPVGERDARLLELREWAFGRSMRGAASCPACGAELELPVDVAQIRAGSELPPAEEQALEVDGCRIRYRLPDSDDLREAAQASTVGQARAVLLRRCLLEAKRGEAEIDPTALPEAAVGRVEAAMAEREAHTDMRFALSCPDCGHDWEAELDVGVFLWGEIDQWARRMLVDVATLAAAFGWSEDEVVRLGPARREAYLELAGR